MSSRNVICRNCKKSFFGGWNWKVRLFCSRKCASEWRVKQGILPPSMLGKHHSKATKEKMRQHSTTHGMRRTKFYGIWQTMNNRCRNPRVARYKNYGGRGIKVLWATFEDFRNDMFESYLVHLEKHSYGQRQTSIDRVNNNGHYCKKNCRWATAKEQANNRRKRKLNA